MNYPEKIYKKFEIVEKNIYGQTFYGCLRVYNIFGCKFKRHMLVRVDLVYGILGSFDSGGSKWVEKRSCVENAIKEEHGMAEYSFKKKVTQ